MALSLHLEKLMKHTIWIITCVLAVCTIGCSVLPKGYQVTQPISLDKINPPANTPQLPAKLAEAKQLLKDQSPKKALNITDDWIDQNEKSDFMDYALYFKGQSLFDSQLYYQSFEAYEELLNKHGASSLYSASLQMQTEIARLFIAGAKRVIWKTFPIGAQAEGIEILERVTERWPGSQLAGDALMTLADHYYNTQKYLEAQHSYQMLLDNYPQSSHYKMAMFQNAQATHGQYLGPNYDTLCLDEAIIRHNKFQHNFPQKAKELNVDDILNNIEQQKIEKDFQIAEFYRKTGKTDAAIQYWTLICKEYPNSEAYKLAQSQIDMHQQVK